MSKSFVIDCLDEYKRDFLNISQKMGIVATSISEAPTDDELKMQKIANMAKNTALEMFHLIEGLQRSDQMLEYRMKILLDAQRDISTLMAEINKGKQK